MPTPQEDSPRFKPTTQPSSPPGKPPRHPRTEERINNITDPVNPLARNFLIVPTPRLGTRT